MTQRRCAGLCSPASGHLSPGQMVARYNYNVTTTMLQSTMFQSYNVTIYNTMTTFYLYNSVQPHYTPYFHLPYTVRGRCFGEIVILTSLLQKILDPSLKVDFDSKNDANMNMIVWPMPQNTGTGLPTIVATLATLSPPTVWLQS